MGKNKRNHDMVILKSSSQYMDLDDDSGFCGSNLTPPKIIKYDDDMMVNDLINEVKEHKFDVKPNFTASTKGNDVCNLLDNNFNGYNSLNKLFNASSYKSKIGKIELKILSQPEEQHRLL